MLILRYYQGSSCKWRRTGTLTLFLPLFSRPFPLSLLFLPLLFLTAMTPLIQIGGLGQVCKTKLNLVHFSLLTSGGMIFVWISWHKFCWGGGDFPDRSSQCVVCSTPDGQATKVSLENWNPTLRCTNITDDRQTYRQLELVWQQPNMMFSHVWLKMNWNPVPLFKKTTEQYTVPTSPGPIIPWLLWYDIEVMNLH